MSASYGLLSTYPPTQCGLATFTAALRAALAPGGSRDRAGVVRVVQAKTYPSGPEVVGHLHNGSPEGQMTAASLLNRYDVAIVQHEYGIYGGTDGYDLLGVLDRVRVPIIVVLHTVLAAPTPHQRSILNRVTAIADAVVVMTETARMRLLTGYLVDAAKVSVIPHGASQRPAARRSGRAGRPTILTWGLLGPGKGVEWGLVAMQTIGDLVPSPRYVIAGRTHPRVREQQGEAYRSSLVARARALRITGLVRYENGYLDQVALGRLIDQADVVLLPYDSYEQITSGVLIEAIAAHKPIVSTAFPHAVELLASGAGIVVPHRDGPAIGAALRKVLTDDELASSMRTEAARLSPGLRWSAVADQYRSLAGQLLGARHPVAS